MDKSKYVVIFVFICFFLFLIMSYSFNYLEGFNHCNDLSKFYCEKDDKCWWIQDVVRGCARKY